MPAGTYAAYSIVTPTVLSLAPKVAAADPQLLITATYNSTLDKYHAVSVSFEHPMTPINSTVVRKTRLATLMAFELRSIIREPNKDLESIPAVKKFFTGSTGRTPAAMAASPSPAKLQEAGLVFRLAHLCGFFPVKAVERCFGISYRDAKRWVRATRALNIIT